MRRAVWLSMLCACAGAAPTPIVDGGHALDAGPVRHADAGADAGFDAGPPRVVDAGPGKPDAGPPCPAVVPPPGPLAIPRGPGPTLAHPQLVTLAYPGSDDDGDLVAYADAMMQSRWLSEVGADYGVGLGTHTRVALPPLDDAGFHALITIPEVGALVASLLGDGGLPAWPDGGADGFVYLVLYPDGVWANDVGPGGGEHGEYDAGQNLVVGFVSRYDASPYQQETHRDILAHELIEAATDPLFHTAPAYQVTSGLLRAFNVSEDADLCAPSGDVVIDGQSYPRIWSNSAASAWTDPCVPHTDAPWMSVIGPGGPVLAAPGTDVLIPITGVTTDPSLVDWPISVTSRGGDPVFLPADRIAAGETIFLRVHLPDQLYDVTTIYVSSGDPQAPVSMTWPLIVGSCRD